MNDLRFAIRQFRKPGRCLLAGAVIALRYADVCPAAHAAVDPLTRGTATAETKPPAAFPHRIRAACDVEGQTPDYGWFGAPETNNIPRYHLTGAPAVTVQVFDATVEDNRHVRLLRLRQGEWTTLYLDFSLDSRRNDGTANSPFAAGNHHG